MGTVYLVGAGPGDPGLLTLRARRLLRRADVVVHDALLSPEILARIPAAAERIDVGKRCGGKRTSQEEINAILAEAAQRARRVVRLKGGDPFVFGRGGEEALALRAAGVRFRVVPGITAGVGVPAYAGIPVTHRELSSSVTFVTGHEGTGPGQGRVDWEALARVQGTLVIYMGVGRLPALAERLIRGGRDPATPAAVVEWGTCARQRTARGALAEIGEVARDAGLSTPALVIVGEVAALHERLDWFDPSPVSGARILVGRSRPEPSRLARSLTALGAQVTEFPRLEAVPASDSRPLRRALASAGDFDWILFTSMASVESVWRELRTAGQDTRALAGVRLAAFGATSARALARRGVRPDLETATFDPERLATALTDVTPLTGCRMLFPRESAPESPITTRLRAGGARVREIAAFGIASDAGEAAGIRTRLADGAIDAVVLTSSSVARNLARELGTSMGGARVIAIGPETAQTALACGLPVHAVPGEQTLPGLIRGLHELLGAPDVPADEPIPGAAPRRPRIASQP